MATYNISTYDELQAISPTHLADDCVLLNDIDASTSRTENPVAGQPGTYNGFVPIGTSAAPFTGSFDGGGFTISNLYVNVTANNPTGLFGSIAAAADAAEFKNLKMTNANINGSGAGELGIFAGILQGKSSTEKAVVSNIEVQGAINTAIGYNSGGLAANIIACTVTSCKTNVTIISTSTSSGSTYKGLFSGSIASSAISSCVSGGSISNTVTANREDAIGGFVGQVASASPAVTITSCKSSGAIISTNSNASLPLNYLGGFIGKGGSGANSPVITKCYASMSIIENGTNLYYAGGFAGYIEDCSECFSAGSIDAPSVIYRTDGMYIGGFAGNCTSVTNCYSIVDVCKNGISSSAMRLGGFAGIVYTITDCYSAGYVNPKTISGGFCGVASTGTRTTCYWDTDTSGLSNAVGSGASTGITGQTTAEMKLEATYTGFDFDAIWDIPTYTQPTVSQSNLTVWPSATGDYENFEAGTNDDDSFVVVIPSTNEIRWIESLESLLVGTAADEWKIASNKLETPLSPLNFGVKRQSNYGSAYIQPNVVNEVLLFVDFVGRKVREMTWGADVDKYVAPDMTSLAEHITKTGIVNMAHQRNPDSMLWCVLTDGSLISLVYDREQNVIAWSDHPIDGLVQSVCVTPGTSEDEVWISVQRTFDGETVTYEGETVTYEGETVTYAYGTFVYIEKMATRIETEIENAFFVDSGIVTSVAASDTITGLTHLKGEQVAILADGEVIYDGTEAESIVDENGEITLPASATYSVVNVGLPYDAVLQPMRIVINDVSGTSLAANTRVNDIKVIFLNSLGVQYGNDENNLFDFDFDDVRLENADYITGLFSGDIPAVMSGLWSSENPIIIKSSQPYPCVVKAIIASFDVGGD